MSVSGPEFQAELGRIPPDPAPRVVSVTGGAFTQGTAADLEPAENRMVEKPLEAEALRALVNDFPRGRA